MKTLNLWARPEKKTPIQQRDWLFKGVLSTCLMIENSNATIIAMSSSSPQPMLFRPFRCESSCNFRRKMHNLFDLWMETMYTIYLEIAKNALHTGVLSKRWFLIGNGLSDIHFYLNNFIILHTFNNSVKLSDLAKK